METVWEHTMRVLTEAGIDAYPPATKKGECHSPYTVVKEDGATQIAGYSSQVQYITFMVYVPVGQYQELSKEKKKVEDVLSEKMYPSLLPTGQETPPFYDDSVKAFMTSIMYRFSRRNVHL